MAEPARAPSMDIRCVPPSSMHPHLQLAISDLPMEQNCELHVDLFLDDAVFLDVYELADLWGPATLSRGDEAQPGALSGYKWSTSPEVSDLERPAYYPATGQSFPRAELTVSVPFDRLLPEGDLHIFDIPAHGRYLPPRTDGTARKQYNLGPRNNQTGRMCDAEFTVSFTCGAANGSLVSGVIHAAGGSSCLLPVGNATHAALVEGGTLVAVLSACGWVIYQLYRMIGRASPAKIKTE